MLPDQVSNPGPLTYESGALPIALRGPTEKVFHIKNCEALNAQWNIPFIILLTKPTWFIMYPWQMAYPNVLKCWDT